MTEQVPEVTSEKEASLHPIQLEFVIPRELLLRIKNPTGKAYKLPEGSVKLTGGVSAIGEDRRFQANVCATIGDTDFSQGYPMYMKVDLVGGFVITSKDVSDESARQWATRATRFTLLPYLREHVAALTARGGFDPVLLPLVQLPNFPQSPRPAAPTT